MSGNTEGENIENSLSFYVEILSSHWLLVVGFVVGLTLLFLLRFLSSIGLFKSIKISKSSFPAVSVAYKFFKGNYQHDCKDAFEGVTGSVTEILGEDCMKEDSRRTVGIYYDDPEKVDPDACRFAVGVVLSADELKKYSERLTLEKGFKVLNIPECGNGLWTKFPFSGMMSVVVAVKRVYPELKKAMVKNECEDSCCVVESYFQQHMEFFVPMQNVASFKVPEVK